MTTLTLTTSEPRHAKALALLADRGQWLRATELRNGRHAVGLPSQRLRGLYHWTDGATCSCHDFRRRQLACNQSNAAATADLEAYFETPSNYTHAAYLAAMASSDLVLDHLPSGELARLPPRTNGPGGDSGEQPALPTPPKSLQNPRQARRAWIRPRRLLNPRGHGGSDGPLDSSSPRLRVRIVRG